MFRGGWQDIVRGATESGHNEVTKHRTLKERKIVEQEDSDE